MASTSVPTKNWTVASTPRRSPTAAGRHRWRTSSSSRQSTTSGGTGANPSMRWASVTLDQDEGREAVQQAGEEGGRPPGHPPPDQDEQGERGERRAQGDRHVEGGHHAEGPGDRGEHDAEPRHPGVGEEVHARRMEQVGRVERIEPVGERVRRPGEEPGEQRRVPTAARGDRGRMGRPHPPPDADGQGQVGECRRRGCRARCPAGPARPVPGATGARPRPRDRRRGPVGLVEHGAAPVGHRDTAAGGRLGLGPSPRRAPLRRGLPIGLRARRAVRARHQRAGGHHGPDGDDPPRGEHRELGDAVDGGADPRLDGPGPGHQGATHRHQAGRQGAPGPGVVGDPAPPA